MIRGYRPWYGSPLRIVAGPERIEAGWWEDLAARDYYVAVGAKHEQYWIYRERIADANDESEHRWFLHGLFG